MAKPIHFRSFMPALSDDQRTADRAAEIAQAILAAGSPRLTEVAAHLSGSRAASYKRLQRFLKQSDPRQVLWRLFQEQAEFVIGDVTEIERPQARRTEYVGILQDGKTRGFWGLLLATPYRERAIPCGVVTTSSKTIATQGDSRNQNHFCAFAQLKDLLGERPLVLDRAFCYLELFLRLVAEQIHFVIRLNLGSHPPTFYDAEGHKIRPTVLPGQQVIDHQVGYQGQVCVNLIGVWPKGLSEPLWVMTDLEAERGLRIYLARMKIEETFRDLKRLLGMARLMNQRQERLEKMLALLFLVYAIALLVGERLRDFLYGDPVAKDQPLKEPEGIPSSALGRKGSTWKRYSGLFVLFKQK